MKISRRLRSWRALYVALFLSACGDQQSAPHLQPRVRFFVDERPHDATNAEIETDEARYGDPVRIVIEGLEPESAVLVTGRYDGVYVRQAVFGVPADGNIDLARDAPRHGTWTTADPDGIFWSAAPEAEPPAGLDLALAVTVTHAGDELASATLRRRYINSNVREQMVSSGTRVGSLALPPGDGPYPAVLVFGGSEGGSGAGRFLAMYLASLGYVAFGVGYFGEPGLPASLTDVPLEILEDDLAFLAADPRVDPARIAVWGGSRGGELALLLGAKLDGIRAVIAQVPSGYVWEGFAGPGSAAWTFRGEPLPAVPASGVGPYMSIGDDGVPRYVYRPSFEADVAAASPEALAAALIPIADRNVSFLMLAGSDDQLWPSCDLADVAWEQLTELHRQTFGDRFECFAGAGHGFSVPVGWSMLGSTEAYFPGLDAYLVTGGSDAANAAASRAADTAIRGFLEASIGPGATLE